MEIRVDPHTLRRAAERGVTLDQTEDVLRTGTGASGSRTKAKFKVYLFQRCWQARYYEHQHVKVIYTAAGNTAITITVIASYGTCEAGM